MDGRIVDFISKHKIGLYLFNGIVNLSTEKQKDFFECILILFRFFNP